MMEWSHKLLLKNWGFLWMFIAEKRDIVTLGVSSRVLESPFHITMLDYDALTDDEVLKNELKWLQRLHRIGNFIVLKSSEQGRHAVCVDVLTTSEIIDIINSSNCDETFKKAPTINQKRCWVLRCATKGNKDAPTYLYTVKSQYEGENLQSTGHSVYLEYCGAPIDLQKPFGPEEVETHTYSTKNKNL